MSPYRLFGLAMLAIVIFSLVVTGNLAAKFNERAKRTLRPRSSHLRLSSMEQWMWKGRRRRVATTVRSLPAKWFPDRAEWDDYSRRRSLNQRVAPRGRQWSGGPNPTRGVGADIRWP